MKKEIGNTFRSALVILSLAASSIACNAQSGTAPTADYVFTSGKVYTVNKTMPWAEAVAVKGNKIAFVGSDSDAKKLVGKETKVINLKGKMMLPGFIDSHFHLIAGALMTAGMDMAEAITYEEHIKIMKDYKAAHPNDKFITGFGYKPAVFKGGIRRELLDEIFGDDVAVVLFEISGHAGWANTAALKQTGNFKKPKDVLPGYSYIHTDKNGVPTGWIIETPQLVVLLKNFVHWNKDYIKKRVTDQIQKNAAAGLTTLYDAGWPKIFKDEVEGVELLLELAKENKLKQRVFASSYHSDRKETPVENILRWESMGLNDRSPYVEAKIFKMNMDGEPNQYTMVMLEPYSDRPGYYGTPTFKDKQYVYNILRKAVKNNIDVHTHAMGDAVVRQYLDNIEKLKKEFPKSTTRFSLAHTFMVDKADRPRFGKLDVVASFAGHWTAFTPDMVNLGEKMMGDRIYDVYNPKPLIEGGAKVSLGSDYAASGYLSSYKMLPQIESIITRKQYNLDSAKPLPPAGAGLTVEEAIEAATYNGAYQLHKEDQLGSIEVGKLADLVVLDKNLFDIKPERISDVKVLMTMMDGNVTYKDESQK